MRAVVQLVSEASVTVENSIVGKIENGLMVLLGVNKEDTKKNADYLATKIIGLRIFPNKEKLMNKSLLDVNGQILVVSQFTLYGDCRKGRRPSYNRAAPPEKASLLYDYFIQSVKQHGVQVQSGKFQTMMKVKLTNDGPVTIILDSEKKF